MTNEYDQKEKISVSCLVVSAVFFTIISQIFYNRVPEIVTQVFRPIMIVVLLIRMLNYGSISSAMRNIALTAAIYFVIVLLLNSWNSDEFMLGGAIILYLLMFWTVTGTDWNKREVYFIILSCFLAAVLCAITLFQYNAYNDPTLAQNGELIFNGIPVNRNKNAYVFGLGTVIGVAYLTKGGKHKFVCVIMTLLLAYALVYSQCRGAFICTVLALVTVLALSVYSVYRTNPRKAWLRFALLIAALILGYIVIKNSDFNRLIDEDSTSGREIGIRNAWNMFLGSGVFEKIFGNGFMYEELHSDTIGAHLVYVAYLVSTGLIGAFLIALIFITSLAKVRGSLPFALCVFATARTFFEGLDYYIYIPLILGIVIYNCYERKGRNSDELFKGQ